MQIFSCRCTQCGNSKHTLNSYFLIYELLSPRQSVAEDSSSDTSVISLLSTSTARKARHPQGSPSQPYSSKTALRAPEHKHPLGLSVFTCTQSVLYFRQTSSMDILCSVWKRPKRGRFLGISPPSPPSASPPPSYVDSWKSGWHGHCSPSTPARPKHAALSPPSPSLTIATSFLRSSRSRAFCILPFLGESFSSFLSCVVATR